MKDTLPIPVQCISKKNEYVSSYVLHAGASRNYILISIFKYLLDFTSLQILQIYEKEHFQIEYRSISCIFQVRSHGLF